MKKPFVSVIIPVYNGARFIAEAVESVCVQNYEPLEIIVVDDGSTDDTPMIVRSFQDIRYIRQANQGVAAARNTGIENSRGELIAFLDADDYWTHDKLNIQVDCLLKHPHVGYTLGMQRNFLESGTERPFWLREEHLLEEHTGFLPTLLIRRRIFDRVGLFNTDFRITEDVEWFSRAEDVCIPRMVVPEVVLYRRIHDANLSYQTKAGNPLLLRALRTSVRRKGAKESGT
ncbi:MAG: glycosyltransferase family 2 protein [Nitrospirota bacterium]|nr:glycosyltransferase family 2 protein [Nitrospirota bacterium]